MTVKEMDDQELSRIRGNLKTLCFGLLYSPKSLWTKDQADMVELFQEVTDEILRRRNANSQWRWTTR